jgi:hypothetical protein
VSPYADGATSWKAPLGTLLMGVLGWVVVAEVVWRLAERLL